MSHKNVLENLTPSMAYEEYKKQNFTGIPALDILAYIHDYLIEFKQHTLEKALAVSNDDVYALSEFAALITREVSDIPIKSWENLEILARQSSDMVAAASPKHGNLARIANMASDKQIPNKQYH
jgi:hypothetical protein